MRGLGYKGNRKEKATLYFSLVVESQEEASPMTVAGDRAKASCDRPFPMVVIVLQSKKWPSASIKEYAERERKKLRDILPPLPPLNGQRSL